MRAFKRITASIVVAGIMAMAIATQARSDNYTIMVVNQQLNAQTI